MYCLPSNRWNKKHQSLGSISSGLKRKSRILPQVPASVTSYQWPTIISSDQLLLSWFNTYSDPNSYDELCRLIGIESSTVHQMCDVWNQYALNTQTKICIQSCHILAALLCSNETWTLTKADRALEEIGIFPYLLLIPDPGYKTLFIMRTF